MDETAHDATPQQSSQTNLTSPAARERRPKSLAKACSACRLRKIRCDAERPKCGACTLQTRECNYQKEPTRKRPTFSQIASLRRGQTALRSFIITLKQSDPAQREELLAAAVGECGIVQLSTVEEDGAAPASLSAETHVERPQLENGSFRQHHDRSWGQQRQLRPPQTTSHSLQTSTAYFAETPQSSSEDEFDIAYFISIDDSGRPNSFGPSSALYNPSKSHRAVPASKNSSDAAHDDNIRNHLIAKAALQRHLEHNLSRSPLINDVPTDLGLHLLNLHWTRQHHSFLLTYRPAITRDMQCGGPQCSEFMLNAIFACSSKFSQAPQVLDVPGDRTTAGLRFFRRCDEMLASDGLLMKPHITTIIALLLLGSTYNARGETSKAWLHTGYALRMVYDLGLHLDPRQTTQDPEEIEICRRVFWGAVVCDKLQSLYLGRPFAINLRDLQVSHEFFDLYEETEPFVPKASEFRSPTASISPDPQGFLPPNDTSTPMQMHSVTTFQQLCLLSKIMTVIINRFYVVGANFSNAHSSLEQVDRALEQWHNKLAPELDFRPWLPVEQQRNPMQPPNIMVLHALYHSLIILGHRPFISDGHLRTVTPPLKSWDRCTVAGRCITAIASAYNSTQGLTGAPYVLAYTIYVACTIHVRNSASRDSTEDHRSMLRLSIGFLEQLRQVNNGVSRPLKIIRQLVEENNIDLDSGVVAMSEDTTLIEQAFTGDKAYMGFDLDAIFGTFPSNMHNNNGISTHENIFEADTWRQTDPLFGLMDASALGSDFMPTTMTPQHFEAEVDFSCPES